MLETLKAAIVVRSGSMDYWGKTRDYEAAYQKTQDPRDRELAHVYRCLSQGKQLISINKAVQIAGVRANGEPVLAFANASAIWAWFVYDGGVNTADRRLMSAFVSDYRRNPGFRKSRGKLRTTKQNVMRFDRSFFPVRPKEELRARVPIVPVKHRPRAALSNYHILWEANWQSAPVDPLLLKRVSREFFEIVAAWDLTELERLVVEMAAFAGE